MEEQKSFTRLKNLPRMLFAMCRSILFLAFSSLKLLNWESLDVVVRKKYFALEFLSTGKRSLQDELFYFFFFKRMDFRRFRWTRRIGQNKKIESLNSNDSEADLVVENSFKFSLMCIFYLWHLSSCNVWIGKHTPVQTINLYVASFMNQCRRVGWDRERMVGT